MSVTESPLAGHRADAVDILSALREGWVAAVDGVRLVGSQLAGAELAETRLTYLDLSGSDLRGAELNGAHLEHVNLTGADLRGANLTTAWLENVDLTGADLSDADLGSAKLRRCCLEQARLVAADLRGASLVDCCLQRADLTEAELREVASNGCRYTGANLVRARDFFLTREIVAAALVSTSSGDPEKLGVAAAVEGLSSWCWDAWARFQANRPSYLVAWAVETFRRHEVSGCLEEFQEAVLRSGARLDLANDACLITVPVDQFMIARIHGRTFAARRAVGPFRIGPQDLLGALESMRVVMDCSDPSKSQVEALMHPIDERQAASTFASLAAAGVDGELIAPFAPSAPDGSAYVVPAATWDEMTATERAAMDREESSVRQELRRFAPDLPSHATVLDPCCSSGAALAAIGALRPDVRLVGLDKSPAMVEAARARLGQFADVSCTTADSQPPLEVSPDLCILRAAAHTICSPTVAESLLAMSIDSLVDGGYLVLTSVLPPYHCRADLERHGMEVLQTTARDASGRLFPFYRTVKHTNDANAHLPVRQRVRPADRPYLEIADDDL